MQNIHTESFKVIGVFTDNFSIEIKFKNTDDYLDLIIKMGILGNNDNTIIIKVDHDLNLVDEFGNVFSHNLANVRVGAKYKANMNSKVRNNFWSISVLKEVEKMPIPKSKIQHTLAKTLDMVGKSTDEINITANLLIINFKRNWADLAKKLNLPDDMRLESLINNVPQQVKSYDDGCLFIYGKQNCGKTFNSEALRKYFNKAEIIEGDEMHINQLLPTSAIVLYTKKPIIPEDMTNRIISFENAMVEAGLGEFKLTKCSALLLPNRSVKDYLTHSEYNFKQLIDNGVITFKSNT